MYYTIDDMSVSNGKFQCSISIYSAKWKLCKEKVRTQE